MVNKLNDIPDKNLTKLLDSDANPPLVRKLVWTGIIPPTKFIRALNLSSNNSFLTKYGLTFLALFGFFYIGLGAISFFASFWELIPLGLKLGVVSAFLTGFLYCGFRSSITTKTGLFCTTVGIFLTGILLFLSNGFLNYGMDYWTTLGLWVITIIPWILISSSGLLWLFWLTLLYTFLLSFGIEYAIPGGIVQSSDFFCLLSVLSFVLLGLREWAVSILNFSCLNFRIIRYFLLFLSLFFAGLPIVLSLFGMPEISLYTPVLVLVLLLTLETLLYVRIFPDLYSLTIIVFLICILLSGVFINTYFFSHNQWVLIFIGLIALYGTSSILICKIKQTLNPKLSKDDSRVVNKKKEIYE